jgi:hypothetical protein
MRESCPHCGEHLTIAIQRPDVPQVSEDECIGLRELARAVGVHYRTLMGRLNVDLAAGRWQPFTLEQGGGVRGRGRYMSTRADAIRWHAARMAAVPEQPLTDRAAVTTTGMYEGGRRRTADAGADCRVDR